MKERSRGVVDGTGAIVAAAAAAAPSADVGLDQVIRTVILIAGDGLPAGWEFNRLSKMTKPM